MIRSFKDADTLELFEKGRNRRFANFGGIAGRKLLMIEAAVQLADLRIPPNNRLEALKGKRKGQHSIRINDQYRVCFIWKEDGAHNVEIVDDHDE
ncbi:type II toxin-antitoxin system RelE/ParE family toxin [Silvibacterium sp.]|uniref:type II toxin-antitoxin system RelE/ParE family toxin n=1 Tax=Silvibacterium sp. TaxID=1964179 RepID=UPI0039E57843